MSNLHRPLSREEKKAEKEVQKFRAMQLRRLRGFADISREKFELLSGIPKGTLKSWEETGTVNERNVERVLEGFTKCGVFCSSSWLLEGTGSGPSLFGEASTTKKHAVISDEDKLAREIDIFYENYVNAIVIKIEDDSMYPYFKQDDYVGGLKYYGSEISNLVGLYCIVEKVSGEKVVRKLKLGSTPGYYNLFCENSDSDIKQPVEYNIKLSFAAEVKRFFRKSALF